jgi:hypothetical protein
MFSGIADFLFDLHGSSSTPGVFTPLLAKINADYSNVIPLNHAILRQMWVVNVHLASISNEQHAVNTGWAIEEFRLEEDRDSAGNFVLLAGGRLRIRVTVALGDRDAFIHKLSYSVSIVGKLIRTS